MANKKILIEIKVNDKATPEVKKTDEAVKGLSSSVRILNKEQKEKIIVDEKAKIVNKAKIDALKREAAAQLEVAVATDKTKATSGLNNAILLETGRLASDASYGFQGIANNLGQLLSLFQTSAKNAGGFGAALKQVGSQLFGIGGILIGIQLLISFLPNLEKAFKNWRKETTLLNEVLIASAEIAGKSISRFEVLTEAVTNSSKSTKEKNLALKLLNQEYPDFNANVLMDAANNKKAADEIENYTKILNKKAMAQAAQTLREEAYTELFLKQIEVEEIAQANGFKDYEDLVSQREEVEEKKSKTMSVRAKTRIRDSKNLLTAELRSEISAIESLEKRIEALKKFTFLEDDSNKKGLGLKKDFVSGQLNFDEEIEKSAARVSKSLQENKDKQIQIEADSVIELARIRQEDFADRQQKRVDGIKNDEDRAKAQIKINIEIAESQASLNTYIEQIQKEAERKKNARNLADQEKAYAQLEKLQGIELQSRLKFDIAMEDMDLNRIEKQRDLNELATENKIKLLNRELSHAESVGNSTIAIQEKINNVNAASNRASVKLDEIEFETKKEHLMNLGSAIVEFAGESSTAGKAVSIAMAIVNTEEAITEALTLPSPFNFIAAAAVGLKGASSIRKILSTKIPGKEPSNSGASGEGGTVNAPDFNVVGTSETSQLAQAVNGREDSIVRAFVVSSEITSQQELDRKRINTAGL